MNNPVSSSDMSSDKSVGFAACTTYLCKPVLILIVLNVCTVSWGPNLISFFHRSCLAISFLFGCKPFLYCLMYCIIRCLGETACGANGFKQVVFYIQIVRRILNFYTVLYKFLTALETFASMCIELWAACCWLHLASNRRHSLLALHFLPIVFLVASERELPTWLLVTAFVLCL